MNGVADFLAQNGVAVIAGSLALMATARIAEAVVAFARYIRDREFLP